MSNGAMAASPHLDGSIAKHTKPDERYAATAAFQPARQL
jgi:hypothetical protein